MGAQLVSEAHHPRDDLRDLRSLPVEYRLPPLPPPGTCPRRRLPALHALAPVAEEAMDTEEISVKHAEAEPPRFTLSPPLKE